MSLARLAPVLCALALAAAGAAGVPAASRSPLPPLRWGTGLHGFYTVPLPVGWRFKNESYPSDHATHLWYDPANRRKKLLVVVSGCVGCVSKSNATVPNPQGGLPRGVTSTYRISPGKLAFAASSAADPYPDNGVVIVTRHGKTISGSIVLQLWLPAAQHGLATYILDNFAAEGHNG